MMLNTLQQSTHKTTIERCVKLIKVEAVLIKRYININIIKILNNNKEFVFIPHFKDTNKRNNNYIK